MFDWSGQSNSSRESVAGAKYVLKVFAIFMFSVNISQFSFKAIFELPNECLFEKYGLELFQKGFESRQGF